MQEAGHAIRRRRFVKSVCDPRVPAMYLAHAILTIAAERGATEATLTPIDSNWNLAEAATSSFAVSWESNV
jgi:hypothetical protein